jgi:WD40 repeat protein
MKSTNETPKNSCVLSGYHKRGVLSVSFCNAPQTEQLEEMTGETFLATGAGDDNLRIFKLKTTRASTTTEITGELVGMVERAHDADVNTVAWNPQDSSILISGGDDGKINIWSIQLPLIK